MADQNRRFAQAVDRRSKIGDVIINAEIVKVFTPRAIAMPGQVQRMAVVALRLKVGNQAHIPALGMAVTAMNKKQRRIATRATGGVMVNPDVAGRHASFREVEVGVNYRATPCPLLHWSSP